jgi:hypothetical protein
MGKPPGSTHAVARDALEAYKQARLAFVNSLNEMLRKDDPSLDAALLDGECLALLHRPLAQDIVPGIQTSALAAMRALASRVDRAGDVLATPETLGKIVSSLSHADPAVVVAGCGVARALASKREAHVRALFDAGALPPPAPRAGRAEPRDPGGGREVRGGRRAGEPVGRRAPAGRAAGARGARAGG